MSQFLLELDPSERFVLPVRARVTLREVLRERFEPGEYLFTALLEVETSPPGGSARVAETVEIAAGVVRVED